jgi:hypothetical protein
MLLLSPTDAPVLSDPAPVVAGDFWDGASVTLFSVVIGSVLVPLFLEVWKRVLDRWASDRVERKAGVERVMVAAREVMSAAPIREQPNAAYAQSLVDLRVAIYALDVSDEAPANLALQGALLGACNAAAKAHPHTQPWVNFYAEMFTLKRVVSNRKDVRKIARQIEENMTSGLQRDELVRRWRAGEPTADPTPTRAEADGPDRPQDDSAHTPTA